MESNERKECKLENLYLDPNNYRFIDQENYIYVEENDALKPEVQTKTLKFICGKNNEEIKELVESMRDNGFLEVDVIQVKEIKENSYLVIEGNRRVSALKYLKKEYKNGGEIGNLNPKIFEKIPVQVISAENREKQLIIMGLKHISGNKKWESINQAKLVYDYLKPYFGKPEYYEVEKKLSKSLAINISRLKNIINAYCLIDFYRSSGPKGTNFYNRQYSIFAEAIKQKNIVNWLEWDKEKFSSDNEERLERFFSWIRELEIIDYDENDDDLYWDEEYLEPIIKKGTDIRELANFINNEEALIRMEEYRNVFKGSEVNKTKEKENIKSVLKEMGNEIRYILKYEDVLSYSQFEELKSLRSNISEIIGKNELNPNFSKYSLFFEIGKIEHFKELEIVKYKIFDNFKFDKLKKINIITGKNNSGKTTLLEAIYLLISLNDINSIFNLMKNRTKLFSLNSEFLNSIFPNCIYLKGIYNNVNLESKIEKYEESEIEKKLDYLTSYKIFSKIEDYTLESKIHTFKNEASISNYETIKHLCNSSFQSPYFYDAEEFKDLYNKSLIQKVEGETVITKVINFMKKIDNSIKGINLIEKDGIQRFIVDSDKFTSKNEEFSFYGDGIQRIFKIALSFVANKNGVVLIDEFDAGLHYSLLIDFTKFLQELSETFNVQVFLSTHSIECIDAFVKNEFKNDDIAIHLLESPSVRKYIGGIRYKDLRETISLEVRGDRVE